MNDITWAAITIAGGGAVGGITESAMGGNFWNGERGKMTYELVILTKRNGITFRSHRNVDAVTTSRKHEGMLVRKTGLIVAGLNHAMHVSENLIRDQLEQTGPPELKGFPGAKYIGKTKSGRYVWEWNGKKLEWTEKANGQVEMYDKTGKKHLGKYSPSTGNQIKDPIKIRIADFVKYGINLIKMPVFIFIPDVEVLNQYLYPNNFGMPAEL